MNDVVRKDKIGAHYQDMKVKHTKHSFKLFLPRPLSIRNSSRLNRNVGVTNTVILSFFYKIIRNLIII